MPLLNSDDLDIFHNPERVFVPYRDGRREAILSLDELARAQQEITSWRGYEATPLHRLNDLAARAGLRSICYKDEARRFGLGSFKALGGAYAVLRVLQAAILQETGHRASSLEILSGAHASVRRAITVACATDGNHGRSVAWGAQIFGCGCTIYVHAGVSAARVEAIEAFGARVVRVAGNCDNSVHQVAKDGQRDGWTIVSDTSYPGYVTIPRDVMQGYGVMVEEAIDAMAAPPSHVFVQAGVGGLAASVAAYLWERFGAATPRLVVVEPQRANCLLRSARNGTLTPDDGPLDTIMAGLACGEVSVLAWDIVSPRTDAFIAIADAAAEQTMRLLATPGGDDSPIAAGESAVAGLAALLLAAEREPLRSSLGLDATSTVLVFGTEGATDPELYRSIVGMPAHEVLSAEPSATDHVSESN